ncbi:hypothetical protein DFS34DRAFT_578272 [Phlyctochytrium arcticum]|nr:hypothetical protein DFS34DRAFT_578272 [Phlyctochytrium arcticum]
MPIPRPPGSSAETPVYTPPHDSPVSQPQPDTDEDPYITRIKKSGCFKEHEALQDCHFEKKDWRKCRDEMMAFRECFDKTVVVVE